LSFSSTRASWDFHWPTMSRTRMSTVAELRVELMVTPEKSGLVLVRLFLQQFFGVELSRCRSRFRPDRLCLHGARFGRGLVCQLSSVFFPMTLLFRGGPCVVSQGGLVIRTRGGHDYQPLSFYPRYWNGSWVSGLVNMSASWSFVLTFSTTISPWSLASSFPLSLARTSGSSHRSGESELYADQDPALPGQECHCCLPTQSFKRWSERSR
jgi:hypothetical protein